MTKYIASVWGLILRIFEYAALVGLALLLLIAILLYGAYGDLRQAINSGLSGKSDLSAAVQELKGQNWGAAETAAAKAQSEFAAATEALSAARSNQAVQGFGFVRAQIDDLDYLLQTGEILSRSVATTLPLLEQLETIRSGVASRNFNDLKPADKVRFLELIYDSQAEINGLKANVELASLNLGRIHKIGLLFPLYGQIADLKQTLDQTDGLMAKISPLIKLLPALAGYPADSRFLIVLQNNDELRPSGGFIGTYGLLITNQGVIKTLTTDDSYHLDMPASLADRWNLAPPEPLKKYLKVEKWYLRDANWSPDWPVAARQIVTIYNGEKAAVGKPTTLFTGVVAITPDLVSDLIKLVGPITVNGTTYQAGDFQNLLQYNVEIAYKQQNISAWDRKDIINGLVDQLRNRLLNLPASAWGQLLTILDNNITERNIQLYFFNPDWEKLAQDLGADGAMANPPSDFLMVVDANLAAYKTDLVMKKTISYGWQENANGLEASVQLVYTHQGQTDWRTRTYRSYTRIYAPLGSQLVSLNGAEAATQNLSATNDPTLNKTVFAFFFTVDPGMSRTINITYRLPDQIYKQFQAGQYQLLVEKQAGQRVSGLNLKFQPLGAPARTWQTNFIADRSWSWPTAKK